MKKHLLLLALLPTLLFAQTPFGYGATWHFSFSEYGFSGYLSLTHVGDTTINSYVWQKFQRGGIRHIQTGPDPYNDVMQWPIGGYYFLHSRNDSVFTMTSDTVPQLVYDFSAQIGDSWQYAPSDTGAGCKALPIATVIGIGYDTINGQPAKYWEVEGPMDSMNIQGTLVYGCSSLWCLEGKIYQDFGGTWFHQLFGPDPNLCNGASFQLNTYSLRCFSNGNLSFNRSNASCDYWSLLGLEEENILSFKIYPNPSSGWITIDALQQISTVEVYDLTGRLLAVYEKQTTLELPPQSGLYLLNVTFKNGEQAVQKVLRN